LGFLKQHATEIGSALLEAPPFLSNLSDAEVALLRTEIEKQHLSPQIIEAKAKVERALQETERSLRAGQAMIRKAAAHRWRSRLAASPRGSHRERRCRGCRCQSWPSRDKRQR
jgi:hypothetical protein